MRLLEHLLGAILHAHHLPPSPWCRTPLPVHCWPPAGALHCCLQGQGRCPGCWGAGCLAGTQWAEQCRLTAVRGWPCKPGHRRSLQQTDGSIRNTVISQDKYKIWLENTCMVNAAPLTKLRFWAESPMRRCCRVACSWLLVLEDCSTQASEAAVWLNDTEASHPWSSPRTNTADGSGRRRWLLVMGSNQMLQLWELCSGFGEQEAQINEFSASWMWSCIKINLCVF